MKHIPSHPRSARAAAAFEQALNAQGAVLLEDEWLGARTPHWLRCAEGHEVTAYPEYVHKGGGVCSWCSGMNSEAAWEQFKALVDAKGGTVLAPAWLGASARHLVRCAEGHENPMMPNSIQQGGGICPTCAGCDSRAAEAVFRAFLYERGATLLEPVWLGVGESHHIRCTEGHLTGLLPNNARKQRGCCGICAGNYRGKGAPEFAARLAELGATLLEPRWLGAGKPHRAICVNGHPCRPYPNAVKLGGGICITCAGQDKAVAKAEFMARLAAVGATLLEPEYMGANVPHRVRCAEGHLCKPWPTTSQQGGGICRRCSHRDWDVFYIVTNETEFRVKYGITSGDGANRLKQHYRDGYRTVELLLTGLPELLASDMEDAAGDALKEAGVIPVKGREYYDISALGLIFDIAQGHYEASMCRVA